jgi:hypothetical protein
MDPRIKRRLKDARTPSKVAAFGEREILDRLGKIGVHPTREGFCALAQKYTAAWDLSLAWVKDLGRGLRPQDEDFLGLAACELWKRWCPEMPSMEMLDDWMQEGYKAEGRGQEQEQCDLWLRVWDELRSRFTPEMKTLESAEAVFSGTQCLFNWVQDVEMSFYNAALHNPHYAELGIRFIREFLDQFTEESRGILVNMRCASATLHFYRNEKAEGERLFREMIREAPANAQAYTHLSDALAWRGKGDASPVDYDRAIAVLEEALAYPVTDAADYDVRARLEHLCEVKSKET